MTSPWAHPLAKATDASPAQRQVDAWAMPTLALKFQRGTGFLCAKTARQGPLVVSHLTLKLEALGQAIDLSGSLERFCDHRTSLCDVGVVFDAAGLRALLSAIDWTPFGMGMLEATLDSDGLALQGTLLGETRSVVSGFVGQGGVTGRINDEWPFSAFLKFTAGSDGTLNLTLCNEIVLGPLVGGPDRLAACLHAALIAELGAAVTRLSAETWSVDVGRVLARQLFPRLGWKVPRTKKGTLRVPLATPEELRFDWTAQDETAQNHSSKEVSAFGLAEGRQQPFVLEDAAKRFIEAPRAQSVAGTETARQLAFGAPQTPLWAQVGQRLAAALWLENTRQAEALNARALSLLHTILGRAHLALNGKSQQTDEPWAAQVLAVVPPVSFDDVAKQSWGALAMALDPLLQDTFFEAPDAQVLARAYQIAAETIEQHLGREAAWATWGVLGLLRAEQGLSEASLPLARAMGRGPAMASFLAAHALLQWQEGSHARAMVSAQEWLASLLAQNRGASTDAIEARLTLGTLALDPLGRFAEAEAHFAAVLSEHPSNAWALEGLVMAQAGLGEAERARRHLRYCGQRTATLQPFDQAVALTALGGVWRRALGESAGATECFEAALKLAPTHAPAHLALGELAAERGDMAAWAAQGEAICRAHEQPELPTASRLSLQERVALHLSLAEYELEASHDEERKARGLKHLRGAVDLAPEREAVRRRLEAGLRQVGDFVALAQLLVSTGDHAAQQGDGAQARRWRLQAARLFLGEHRRPDEAAFPLEQILAVMPEDEEALGLILPLFASQKDTAKTTRVLEAAAASARQRGACLAEATFLTQLLELQVQESVTSDHALGWLTRILSCAPQHLLAATQLAALRESQVTSDGSGKNDSEQTLVWIAALEQLKVASVTQAAQAQVDFDIARAFGGMGATAAAITALERAIAAAPDLAKAYLLAAELLERDHQLEDARTWLVRITERVGAGSEIAGPQTLFLRLAKLCQVLKDAPAEIDALRQVMALGGNSRAVSEQLARALTDAGRPVERAQFLESCAEAGWPLEMGPALREAAALFVEHQRHDDARRVLRQAMALEDAHLAEAGRALFALGEAQGNATDCAEGLLAQVRACQASEGSSETLIALLAELLACQRRAGLTEASQMTCAELLSLDAEHLEAHLFLAEQAEVQGRWDVSLDHRHFAARRAQTLFKHAQEQTRTALCDNQRRALALAQDIRPARIEELVGWGPGGGETLPEPLCVQLEAQQQFTTLRSLLEHKLLLASAQNAAALRAQLGALLVDHLDDADAALALLREALAQNPHDMAARRVLIRVYTRLDAHQALADLHFTLSQLESDAEEALDHALKSARLFAQLTDGRATAEQILLTFARRSDVPPIYPPLWQGLKDLGLYAALAGLLAKSLEANPQPDDGRFEELVDTLAGPLKAWPQARAWCERMAQAFTAHDEPFALEAKWLERLHPSRDAETIATTKALFERWAACRQGEAQAAVQAALAEHLSAWGEAHAALAHLRTATLQVDVEPQAQRERLTRLCDMSLAQGDFQGANDALGRLARMPLDHDSADALWRRLAALRHERLSDTPGALEALRHLSSPQESDAQQMAAWVLAAGDFESLLTPVDLTPHISDAALWEGGQKLIVQQQFAVARPLLDKLLARRRLALGTDAVPQPRWDAGHTLPSLGTQTAPPMSLERLWGVIEHTFREANLRRVLCAWRLAWAEQAPVAWQALASLVTHVELFWLNAQGQKDDPLGVLSPEDHARLGAATQSQQARAALEGADLQVEAHLWPAFCLAQHLGATPWLRRTALALEQTLGHEDERKADVLVALGEAELAAGELDAAKQRADALVARGDARAQRLSLEVLRAHGRDDEVLALLEEQARSAEPAGALSAHLVLAEEQARQLRLGAAQKTLQQVPTISRNLAWATLAYQVEEQLKSPEGQASAAALAGHSAPTAQERALWLRREAAVRWWALGAEAQGKQLLLAAHAQEPLTYEAIDAALLHLPADEARCRLEEAMVVLPHTQHAPLWRRLASLVPPGEERVSALMRALDVAEDDVSELGLLLEATRAAGAQSLLAPLLVRLAHQLRAHDAERAASLFLEAAGMVPTLEAAPLWVEAAWALRACDNLGEALALTRRALGAGVKSTALWRLVWALLPEEDPVRWQAAHALVLADVRPDKEHERIALIFAAAEHALMAHQPEYALALTQDVQQSNASLTDDARAVVDSLHARALEAMGDVMALARLWLATAQAAHTPRPHAIVCLRKAAYFVGPLLPAPDAHALWFQLVEADPDDQDAVAQMWALMAQHAAAQAKGDEWQARATLIRAIESRLGVLEPSMSRARLIDVALRLLDREPKAQNEATQLLGRQLHVFSTAWQQLAPTLGPNASNHAVWHATRQLSEQMAQRLAAAQQVDQQLAVLAHTAHLAPQAEREAHLCAAGLMARDQGDTKLAFTLLMPVAQANPGHEEAMDICLSYARQTKQPELIIALLTRRAQRLEAQQAAGALEEAADWAGAGLSDAKQMLRLLQAAQALVPTPARSERLIAVLLHLGDTEHLKMAQEILVQSTLPAPAIRRLGLALARSLSQAPGASASAEALWDHLATRLPNLPEVKSRRLAAARRSEDKATLLAALLSYVHDQHVPAGDNQASLLAEAAQLAMALQRPAVAAPLWSLALSGRAPAPSWLRAALSMQTRFADVVEAQPAIKRALGQVRAWLVVARHVLVAQAQDVRLPVAERLAATDLLIGTKKMTQDEFIVLKEALAQLQAATTAPGQAALSLERLRLSVALLRPTHEVEALARALKALTEALPVHAERASVQRELGSTLGQRMGDWTQAVRVLEGALAEQPGDEPLRLATASALVSAGRPQEALPYLTPAESKGLQQQSTQQLEILLAALVSLHAWRECLPIARQLLGRQPHHLLALQAQARATLAQGLLEEAWQAHVALGESLKADGGVRAWRQATGRPAVSTQDDTAACASVFDDLAQLAQRRGSAEAQIQMLRQALALSVAQDDMRRRRLALRQACQASGAWAEAAQLAAEEAEFSANKREAAKCLLEAAELWQQRLGDVSAARRALWKASTLAPDEAAIWWHLRAILAEPGPLKERMVVAEHLLALVPHAHFDAALWADLAGAFVHEQPARANALFGQAEALGGVSGGRRVEWCEAAWQAQDWSTFVPLAESLESQDAAEGPLRRLRLAEACLKDRSSKERRRWLGRVLSAEFDLFLPDIAQATRRLADVCAAQADTHRAALTLFERLIQAEPFDEQVLRIAARLAGGLKDIDRAYGLYACLLWLLPEDAEAERFVTACRRQHAAQQTEARHTTKLLVRRVQQALEQLDVVDATDAEARPRRAFDVAQLLRRDIEDVLGQMVPIPADMARPRALGRVPDALALFRFAQSPAYFTLRKHLGADLQARAIHAAKNAGASGAQA